MDRFDQETIHALSLLFIGITILWYFVLAVRTRQRMGDPSLETFLRYRSDNRQTSGLSAEVLHASLMGSAFSLASAIYVYLNWAATDGAFVLWSPITWTLGAVVLYVLRGQVFKESRDTWTLHGFLQKKYGSITLKRYASVITIAVFLLQVVAEVYVGLAVLRIFVGPDVPLWVLCLGAGAVFLTYSVIGGLPAVMITDAVKYRLTVFALLIAGIALLDHGGASAVKLVKQSLLTKFVPDSAQSWIILLSLLALNLPLFITDMSVWQRVGAVASEREATRGLGSFAVMLLPWMSGIIFVGIGFSAYVVPPEGWTTAQAILAFFSDSLLFIFLLAGLFAALITTADSYLIAAVQTAIVDLYFTRRLQQVNFLPHRLSPESQREMFRASRVGILTLGIGAIIAGYVFFSILPSLLDLLFVIFGAQTALAPSVLYGLVGKARPEDSGAGIASLVVGGLTAIVCLLLALAGATLITVSLGLWSPILVLTLSTITFLSLKKSSAVRANAGG